RGRGRRWRGGSAVPAEPPPVDVEQVAAAADESQVQVVGTGGAADRAGHGGPGLPAAGVADGAGADQGAGGGVEAQLDAATAAGRRDAGGEGGCAGPEGHPLDLDVVAVVDVADVHAALGG